MACIYLGLCGNGSQYHKSFKLGDAGTAIVFCEPSNGGERHLDFAPIPLSQLRFIAGLAQLGMKARLHRLKPRTFSTAERRELQALEDGLWSPSIPAFYGDSSAVDALNEKMRERLRAVFSSRGPVRVDGNDTVH